MGTTKDYFINLFSRNDLTLNVILDSLCCNNVEELCVLLKEFFKESISSTDIDINMFQKYHEFLYILIDLCNNKEDIYLINLLINDHNKDIKFILKDYNKNILGKDLKFQYLRRVLNDLKASNNYCSDAMNVSSSNEDYKIFAFFIFNVRKPDYIFRLLELKPEYANLKDDDGNKIFINMVEYVNANINNLTDDDIKYYKRIFVMFLESDKFYLSNDELFDLLGYLEKNKRSLSVNKKQQVSFFINEIEKHYSIINGDCRENVISYCNKACPVEIIKRKNDERVDLTNLFTVSIDKVAKDMVGNIIIDDAISLVEHNTGLAYDLYLHIPDVDYFIKKDSETDLFMRNIGENVYTRGYRTRMLPLEISSMCSLVSGSKRNAITIKVLIDKEGKVLDIEFFKSIINVNYNLTTRKSEIFMGPNDYNDEVLKTTLNKLASLATIIRKRRGEKRGRGTKSSLIIEEYNIFADLVVADYFNKVGKIFPYRIFEGKRSGKTPVDLENAINLVKEEQLSDSSIELVNEVLLAYNRTYYDTKPKPNKSFKGCYAGNVGNPLREYISLETDRLIKDLIIAGQTNTSYWEERIERDCIEYTETTAKINELKKINTTGILDK